MLSNELMKRFSAYSVDAKTRAAPPAQPGMKVATLYGTDEVSVNVAMGLVTLPDFGPVPCKTLRHDRPAEWFATVPMAGGYLFHEGFGDPYTAGPGNPLPTVDGNVMAMPYALLKIGELTPAQSKKRGLFRRR